MSEKIKQHQLERGAYVYVRQSTPYQVRNHLEGKELQYSLAERAKQLGFGKITVIDEDLGRSRVRPPVGGSLPGISRSGVRTGSFATGAQQSRLASSGGSVRTHGDTTDRHGWNL